MQKLINNFLIIFFIIVSCGGGGGGAPTDSDDINDNVDPYVFPNAVNYNLANQVEIVTWNIETFARSHTNQKDYVKNLLEKWNADIYFLQEIEQESELANMVNSMPNYSYVVDDESKNLGFALVYKTEYITFNSKNELWASTSSSPDGDSDYENNALYQFAGRPPMENYITWSDGSKSINLYLIGIHYKCCGDGVYRNNDEENEANRRHYASLLLTDYILNNRANENVVVLGDFNNTGSNQTISNPTLSPFTDSDSFDSASSFKLTDLGIFQGSNINWSWQGWNSSYSPTHFDHIIINQSLFSTNATSRSHVISVPTESGMTSNNVDDKISDHQPVMYRFYP